MIAVRVSVENTPLRWPSRPTSPLVTEMRKRSDGIKRIELNRPILMQVFVAVPRLRGTVIQ
jgi:hypothetical protein